MRAGRVRLVHYPQFRLAFGRGQIAHPRGQELVLYHRANAFGFQQVTAVVDRSQVERAENPLQSEYRASHLAAQMKSFSESPPMAWVEYSTRHLL